MSKGLISLIVLIVALACAVSYLFARFTNHEEIIRSKVELERVHSLRDSLVQEVAKRDSAVRQLESKISGLEGTVDELKVEQQKLEAERVAVEKQTWRLFEDDSIMMQLKLAWPPYASRFGLREIYNPAYEQSLMYLVAPRDFATAILLDHSDAQSYREQTSKLVAVTILQDSINHYQRIITNLEREKALAWKEGYDDAYAKYEALNEKYVKLLENPQVSLGFPGWATIAGSVGAGVLLGQAVKK